MTLTSKLLMSSLAVAYTPSLRNEGAIQYDTIDDKTIHGNTIYKLSLSKYQKWKTNKT